MRRQGRKSLNYDASRPYGPQGWQDSLDRLLSDEEPIPALVPEDADLGLLRVDLGIDGTVYNESRISLLGADSWIADAVWRVSAPYVAFVYPSDGMVTVWHRCILPAQSTSSEED